MVNQVLPLPSVQWGHNGALSDRETGFAFAMCSPIHPIELWGRSCLFSLFEGLLVVSASVNNSTSPQKQGYMDLSCWTSRKGPGCQGHVKRHSKMPSRQVSFFTQPEKKTRVSVLHGASHCHCPSGSHASFFGNCTFLHRAELRCCFGPCCDWW